MVYFVFQMQVKIKGILPLLLWLKKQKTYAHPGAFWSYTYTPTYLPFDGQALFLARGNRVMPLQLL